MPSTALWVCWLGLLLCSTQSQGALDHQQQTHEWLIGWQGESYTPTDQTDDVAAAAMDPQRQAASARALQVDQAVPPPNDPALPLRVINLDTAASTADSGKNWVQLLSWQPRLHLHHNFLSAAECDALLAMRPDSQAGANVQEVDDELLYKVEQRIADWTGLPPYHIEGWQLQQGFGKSELSLHTDLLTDRLATEDYQRLRLATVMLVLTDADAAKASSAPATQAPQGSSGSSSSSGGSNVSDGSSGDSGGSHGGSSSSSTDGSSSSSSGWSLVFPDARGGSWRAAALPEEYPAVLEEGKQVHAQLTAAGQAAASPSGRRRQEGETLRLQQQQQQQPTPSSSSAPSSDDVCSGSGSSSGTGLRVTGFKRGSALLLWNVLIDGQTPDAAAAHVVCGPQGGQSQGGPSPASAAGPWVATTWLHNMPVGQDDALALAATCVDKNPSCSEWAEQGYCDDAPGILLGLRGVCRLSCRDCNICQQPTRGSSSSGSSGSSSGSSSSSSGGSSSSSGGGGSSSDTAAQAASSSSAIASNNNAAAARPAAAGDAARSDQSPQASATFGSANSVAAGSHASHTVEVVAAATMPEYIECLYQNMHSLRQEWSEQARGAGVRKARNAIRRDMRVQAAVVQQGVGLKGGPGGGQQEEGGAAISQWR